ncbi:GntR family transcriptional regulator [bacterium]|nr:MAG: GntR family transcriptional regulator [bacterium]
MATEGLLSVEPRKGYFVRPLTVKRITEAYDVRMGLEFLAIEVITTKQKPLHLERLEELLHEREATVSGRTIVDRDLYIATNEAFHNYIIDLANNDILSEVYRKLAVNLLMNRIMYDAKETAGDVGGEHAEMVGALRQRDLERFRRVCRKHIETGKKMAQLAIERAGGTL